MRNIRSAERKAFWDNKILAWERSRYDRPSLTGWPLKWRRKLFLDAVRPFLRGWTIVDAGCGSGHLLEELFSMGIKKYIGCDLSSVAIDQARARTSRLGLTLKSDFININLSEPRISLPNADLCFSLGLLDWLGDSDLSEVLKNLNSPWYLHSFSEKRFSPMVAIHSCFAKISYGGECPSYVPAYRSTSEMLSHLKQRHLESPKVTRDFRMSFSTFVSHLPDQQLRDENR